MGTRPLLLLAGLCVASLSAAGQAPSWRVHFHDSVVQPGEVLRVTVTPPSDVTAVSGTWNERAVAFAAGPPGGWIALVGVDVGWAAGPRVLRLSGVGAFGIVSTFSHTVDVTPKQFRTRRITVNPKFVNPPKSALPRIEREAKLLNAVFATSIPERLWAEGAVRPVEGVNVSGFGVRSVLNGQPRGPHNGLDLAAVTGTPVYAPTPGLIVAAREFYYSGNTVILDHGQGMYSSMMHLSAIDVAEGQRVDRGVLLGKVGATGRVTGPHLHWAVRLHGTRVDPLSLLEALAEPK